MFKEGEIVYSKNGLSFEFTIRGKIINVYYDNLGGDELPIYLVELEVADSTIHKLLRREDLTDNNSEYIRNIKRENLMDSIRDLQRQIDELN